LISLYFNWLKKLFQSRVVLTHPDAPEDTRVVNLFKNRAELKKELGDSQDEIHRLRDRIKLQEAATGRVREQLEALEGRLAAPLSGLFTTLHYQLRDLWATAHAQIGSLVREVAQMREERERRQFLAELNRQTFERQQAARAQLADAERLHADVRGKLGGINRSLDAARSWWKYFVRRELLRRLAAMQAELATADNLLQHARQELQQVEEQGGAKFPGLSLESRRLLNLTALACAHTLAMRLSPASLLGRVREAMSRSEPRMELLGEARSEASACMTAMQEIARARALMLQGQPALQADVRKLVDRLAAAASYRTPLETVPVEASVKALLRVAPGADGAIVEVLGQDLWNVADLFYE
jgi:hypothetical protein